MRPCVPPSVLHATAIRQRREAPRIELFIDDIDIINLFLDEESDEQIALAAFGKFETCPADEIFSLGKRQMQDDGEGERRFLRWLIIRMILDLGKVLLRDPRLAVDIRRFRTALLDEQHEPLGKALFCQLQHSIEQVLQRAPAGRRRHMRETARHAAGGYKPQKPHRRRISRLHIMLFDIPLHFFEKRFVHLSPLIHTPHPSSNLHAPSCVPCTRNVSYIFHRLTVLCRHARIRTVKCTMRTWRNWQTRWT